MPSNYHPSLPRSQSGNAPHWACAAGNVLSHQDSVIPNISEGSSQDPRYACRIRGTANSFSFRDDDITDTFDHRPLQLLNVTTNANPRSQKPELEESLDALDMNQKRAKLTHKALLCEQCLKIDIAQVFEKADEYFSNSADGVKWMPRTASSKEGLYITSFNSRLSQWSICYMCRFFWSMRIGRDDSGGYEL